MTVLVVLRVGALRELVEEGAISAVELVLELGVVTTVLRMVTGLLFRKKEYALGVSAENADGDSNSNEAADESRSGGFAFDGA